MALMSTILGRLDRTRRGGVVAARILHDGRSLAERLPASASPSGGIYPPSTPVEVASVAAPGRVATNGKALRQKKKKKNDSAR